VNAGGHAVRLQPALETIAVRHADDVQVVNVPVLRALDRILPRVQAEECYLTPSSGLEYLPRDRALAKLKRLVAIQNQMRN